jgi:hypothetical protein
MKRAVRKGFTKRRDTSMNAINLGIPKNKAAVMKTIFLLVALFAALTFAQTEKKTGFSVELDMFSGYSNPCYLISGPADIALISDELKVLFDNTKNASLIKKEEIRYPHLSGYRGLLVTTIGDIPQVPKRFSIYAGTIMVPKNDEFLLPPQSEESAKKIEDRVTYYFDAGSKLEKLFLKILPPYMDGQTDAMSVKRDRPNVSAQKILERIPKELLK